MKFSPTQNLRTIFLSVLFYVVVWSIILRQNSSFSIKETTFPPLRNETNSMDPQLKIFKAQMDKYKDIALGAPIISVDEERTEDPDNSDKTDFQTYRPHFPQNLPTLCAGHPRYSNHDTTLKDKPTAGAYSLEKAFEALVANYLAPWIPLSDRPALTPELDRPISMKLLNSMEVLLRGGAFRVRLAGDGRVLYRVQEHWGQTYRISRMTWTLSLLQKALELYPELAKVKCEFYVNVADSPRSTADSVSRDMGGIPVFSFRSSTSYLDVPVPDPVEYGSNGNYVWKTENRTPYNERIPKLVFRGSASSLKNNHDGNWLSVPRVRLAALSKQHPDLIDAGITKWIKLGENTTLEEVEESLAATQASILDYNMQGQYQFIIDVDGGLGSSRKRGILISGSVPFFQKSNWHMWYEPLLKPFYHFLPVDTFLHDLLERIHIARDDPIESQRIIARANCFGESVISEESAMRYWKVLLLRYSQLQLDPSSADDDVSPSMCSLRPAAAEGPMGCNDGWYTFNGSVPFGCRYTKAKNRSFPFECWRDIGRGVEFKFTNDPVHSLYNERDDSVL